MWGKSSWGVAWYLSKTTSQSRCTNPPSLCCLQIREGRIDESRRKQSKFKHPLTWLGQWAVTGTYSYLFTSLSTAIRSRPRQSSVAAWWYLNWWLYLQARHFSTEVLFTHPHMSKTLGSVHATSCSLCSPFSVVITHPQGSGWMCTALLAAENREIEKGRNKAPLKPFLSSTCSPFSSLSRSWGSLCLSVLYLLALRKGWHELTGFPPHLSTMDPSWNPDSRCGAWSPYSNWEITGGYS